MHRCLSALRSFTRTGLVFGFAALVVGWVQDDAANSPKFLRTTIDFGIVCSDVEKSVKFYRDAIGFTEADGFDVPGDFANDAGLSDGHPFHVHVLVLGEDSRATKLKLMQFKPAPGARVDNRFLHSSYGLRYMTLIVDDLDAALKRAAAHGVKPIAKGPVALPEGFPEGLYLANVRDPDGNLVELIGPRPQSAK